MLLFSTTATRHLAQKIHLPHGHATIKQFNDGELFVRIDQEVNNQDVWVLAATQAPAEHMLELFFLLDALTNAGARINLLITYFAYARQTSPAAGEAHSGERIATILKQFNCKKITILHPHHAAKLHTLLPFNELVPLDFFCGQAATYDAVAAPDQGAHAFAEQVADFCGKKLISLTKTRPEHEQVRIIHVEGNVQGKRILLVDDIISTGRTMMHAAQTLKEHGATEVAAAATHGIFAPGAHELLATSNLASVTVTNSVPQRTGNHVRVVDIAPFFNTILQQAQDVLVL